MCETEDLGNLIKRIRAELTPEIEKRLDLLAQYLTERSKGFTQRLIDEIDEDLIDWKSKGTDISRYEHLRNEMFFERL